MDNSKIKGLIGKPDELEALYQEDTGSFQQWLAGARQQYPDSDVVQVWDARLNYRSQANQADKLSIIPVIILSLLAGLLIKLPYMFEIPNWWFQSRFSPVIVIGALVVYFLMKSSDHKTRISLAGGLFICALVSGLMPSQESSDSIIMSQLHLPLVLMSILGLAYMKNEWREFEARIGYIRYLGELAIYTALILIGGIILTLITLSLFKLLGFSIENWYLNYVVVLGTVASPIVATYLYDQVLQRNSKLALIISNTFSPLFMITVVVYLAAMLYLGKSPYNDRDFLILFNGLLLVVLFITVFSISGKDQTGNSRLSGLINIALLVSTLIINTVALSAILFRLTEYGLTPNRVAVTIANILIFTHLLLILKQYAKHLMSDTSLGKVKKAIAGYLPVYTTWSMFVFLGFPILFGFE